ncbi:hypothetical protein FAM09_21455 [Niastella caeni]|uniref:Glycosyltransferase family 39 protein n=1 Tax=Niastella caeni TaxID=2569763 RepID=A0A4S8HMM4_9BACT|nr:hypothetical protein [Niastella caeni]THU35961.1 hypothetical protein FAM09_21455 [Niastella caeni]
MVRKDFYLLGILSILLLLIFLPLFYSEYIFMDEALEIWGYNSTPDLQLFADDGRLLAEMLHSWLFKMTDTIHDIKYIRLVSLFGWMACLPIWYGIIKRSVANVPGYEYLPFFFCLYLVTSLPFIVSVQWATCMQFFIAHTAALVSGALIVQGILSGGNKLRVTVKFAIPALLLGIVSLFFYQSAFACFLLPLLLHFINPFTGKKDYVLISGLVVYFLVYAVYYVLYKVSFSLINNIQPSSRYDIYIHPWEKIKFFLARPLERSFRFTLLTHEDSFISKIYYPIMLGALAVATYIRFGRAKWLNAVKYLAAIGFIFAVAYILSLIVQESYASNRTLMALNLCVFIVCCEMVLFFIKNKRLLQMAGVAVILFFVFCARYNFQQVFLRPVVDETAALKNYFRQNFHNGIQTVHFIRPSEDFMAEKYHVNRSMDEFGVASSCWNWVPVPLTKQLVYEATGDRRKAIEVVVKQWPDKEAFLKSGEAITNTTLLVDVPVIMNSVKTN